MYLRGFKQRAHIIFNLFFAEMVIRCRLEFCLPTGRNYVITDFYAGTKYVHRVPLSRIHVVVGLRRDQGEHWLSFPTQSPLNSVPWGSTTLLLRRSFGVFLRGRPARHEWTQ